MHACMNAWYRRCSQKESQRTIVGRRKAALLTVTLRDEEVPGAEDDEDDVHFFVDERDNEDEDLVPLQDLPRPADPLQIVDTFYNVKQADLQAGVSVNSCLESDGSCWAVVL